jgi:hypothetical protein
MTSYIHITMRRLKNISNFFIISLNIFEVQWPIPTMSLFFRWCVDIYQIIWSKNSISVLLWSYVCANLGQSL